MRIRDLLLHGTGAPVDLVIENGLIADVEPAMNPSEGHRRVLLPGLIDLHTHLREPGGDDAETITTGTAAAAAGGFTDVFAMANTSPVTDDVERVLDIRRRAAGALTRVHVVAAGTNGLAGQTPVDVAALAAIGVRLFSDDGKCVADDDVMVQLLTAIATCDVTFAQHAQDPRIVGEGVINARVADAAHATPWPTRGETDIVARDIAVVRETGARLHVCHVSTAETVELIAAAKREGLPVTAEATPHHLHFTDNDALARGPALKVNPPFRSPADVQALRGGLRTGVIDAIGTDHAPHPAAAKQLGWARSAFGLTALETALPAVAEALTGLNETVDWSRLIDAMHTRPARIGGLRPQSTPARGEPATFTVVAQTQPYAIRPDKQRSRSRNTPFDGHQFRWSTVLTMIDGRLAYRAE